jgi:hypothetical protein
MTTTQNVADVLFKDYLNVPFNKVGNPFFNEDAPFSTYSVGDQVLIDPIPREPTFSEVPSPYPEIAATEYDKYEQDASGVLEKFTRLKLKQVDLIAGGSSAVRYLLDPSDPSSLNLLSNSLQFNYGLNNTTNYVLFIDGDLVPRSNLARSYIFNFRAGYLTFYGTIPPTATFTAGNVEFTFVRYRGRVGVGAALDAVDASLNAVTASTATLDSVLFGPPPAFASGTVVSGTSSFTVNWSFPWGQGQKLGIVDLLYPYVRAIVVEIRQTSPPPPTSWILVTNSLPPTSTTFTFNNGNTFGSITVGADKIFDIRVYGINFANQVEDNYLVFADVAFTVAGVPSAPQNAILVSANSQTQFNVTVTRPQLNNADDPANPLVPDMDKYRITWKAVSSTRFPSMFEAASVETSPEFTANNNNSQTFSITGRNPSTTYELVRVSAKNVINPNFGPAFVPSPLTITTNGLVNADANLTFPVTNFSSDFTTTPRTLWNPGSATTMTNVNYYTAGGSVGRNASTSSFYVNGGRQGTVALDVNELVTLVSEYNTNTNQAGTEGTWTSDVTVQFNGYDSDTGSISPPTTTFATGSGSAAGVDVDPDSVSSVDGRSGSGGAYNGFVILGRFRILPVSPIPSAYFSASRNVYGLRYTLSSQGSRSNVTIATAPANEVKLHTFVVDTLAGNATISSASSSISSITSTATCHGVPSIRTFTITYGFTAGNLGEQFLRSDRLYANLSLSSPILANPNQNFNFATTMTDTPIPNQILTNQTLANRYISNSTAYSNPASLQTSISNVVNFRAYNLLTSGTPTATTTSLAFESSKTLWHDATSFNAEASPSTQISTTVKDFGRLNLNLFTASNRFEFPLTSYSSQTTAIADNQLIFAANAFRSAGPALSSSYYRNYSGFAAPGPDYSTKHETGDNTSGATYKWVVKRFENQTSFTTVQTNTQDKTLRLTINSTTFGSGMPSSLSSLTSSSGAVCFVRQIQTGGQGDFNTAWLNVTEEFGGSLPKLLDKDGQASDTTPGYGNLNLSDGKIKFYSTGFSTDVYTIYVRVGLPNGSTTALSALSLT